MKESYVHGYDIEENMRLQDQAATLVDLLHSDSIYPAGSKILEAGCGVGAQTVTLAGNNPESSIVSVDISAKSLRQAEQRIVAAGLTNVRFLEGDLFELSFDPQSFDHVFVCFVLEHLPDPVLALKRLKTFLRPGGTITVIEGDHGSAYFHPESDAAHAAIQCQVELQSRAGGDALIGRSLYPLLAEAGYREVRVSPRMVYTDSSKPKLSEGFTKKTFTAMIAGVRQAAIDEKIIDPALFDKGIEALNRTTEKNGTFCYTFFKAIGETGSVQSSRQL